MGRGGGRDLSVRIYIEVGGLGAAEGDLGRAVEVGAGDNDLSAAGGQPAVGIDIGDNGIARDKFNA